MARPEVEVVRVATRAIPGRAKDVERAPSSLAPGAIVAGRFRLEQLLGEGGMGAVWAARHVVTKRAVAIKFLKEPKSREFVERFVREAQAANSVRHPNVVQVHDLFSLETGEPAMVMDLFEGETLAARLEREGALPLAEVAGITRRVVSALVAIHAAGIVHRDLKPENIFMAQLVDGRVEPMLLDFGVCKLGALASPESDDVCTTAGRMIGSPCYMAPEQVRGAVDTDLRADIWSLGAILYECLTGSRPFDGDSLAQVVARITTGSVTRVEALAPQVPPELARVIHRMLERQRSERLSDLRELLQALESLAPTGPSVLRAAGPSPASAPAAARLPVAAREAETVVRSKLSTLGIGSLSSSVAMAVPKSRGVARSRLAVVAVAVALLGFFAVVLGSSSERRGSRVSLSKQNARARVASPSTPARIEPAPSLPLALDVTLAAAPGQQSRQAPAPSANSRPSPHRQLVRPIPNFGGRR